MLLGTTTFAAEKSQNVMESETFDVETQELSKSVKFNMVNPVEISRNEVDVLFDIANEKLQSGAKLNAPQARITSPDLYEPNNTIDTAYPYASVNTITTSITDRNSLYTLGMKNAGLHSASDEDWYYISLQAGTEYFVDLRNIGSRNWYIELYYIRSDGTGYYYTTNQAAYKNQPERYFYFTAQDTGTYYIRITSENDWENSMYYYFYVGPVIQYFNISNMDTYGNVQLIGTSYKTYNYDLRGVVPKTTAILELSLSNDIIEGTNCTEIDKMLSAGGKKYYNTKGSNSETINGINGAALGQIWTIGGKCAKGYHVCRWSPQISGRFACIMEPYPGNELLN